MEARFTFTAQGNPDWDSSVRLTPLWLLRPGTCCGKGTMGQRYQWTAIWGQFPVRRREVNIHTGSLMLLFAVPQAAVTRRTPDQPAKALFYWSEDATVRFILLNKDFLGFILLNSALLRLLLVTNLKWWTELITCLSKTCYRLENWIMD